MECSKKSILKVYSPVGSVKVNGLPKNIFGEEILKKVFLCIKIKQITIKTSVLPLLVAVKVLPCKTLLLPSG